MDIESFVRLFWNHVPYYYEKFFKLKNNQMVLVTSYVGYWNGYWNESYPDSYNEIKGIKSQNEIEYDEKHLEFIEEDNNQKNTIKIIDDTIIAIFLTRNLRRN